MFFWKVWFARQGECISYSSLEQAQTNWGKLSIVIAAFIIKLTLDMETYLNGEATEFWCTHSQLTLDTEYLTLI